MNEETFIRGIQLINSLLSENQQIKGSSIDTYFLILKEYNGEDYIQAILELLKKEDLRYGAPSPATIIKYIEKLRKKDIKALEILDFIKRDIILYGSKMPKYKKEIRNAIEAVGGWNKIRFANEYEFKQIEKDFIENFEDSNNQIRLEHKEVKKIKEK